MMHTKIVVAEKEVLIFFEPGVQDKLALVAPTILNHLPDVNVKKIFDDLGLINMTSTEVTLYSHNGDMQTIAIPFS
ncbi:hypothetical protein ACFQZT_18565 [Paenibacillus sp. GCM10027628]|uniref:hypothetical protein n=1 Tax=Paenibacillus sp. GCM10027628 TaxID=3273413 RepID=UPI003634DF29